MNGIFTCSFSKESIQRRVVLLFLGGILDSLNHYQRFQSLRGYTNLHEKHIYRVAAAAAAAAAKSLQSCPTLCDPIDGSLPGSPVPGFSRQSHWSGLSFSSPVHKSEK